MTRNKVLTMHCICSLVSPASTQIEPVIEHIDMVHHLLLYNCPSFVNTTYDNMCYVGDQGDTCFGVVGGWAVGGGVRKSQVFMFSLTLFKF